MKNFWNWVIATVGGFIAVITKQYATIFVILCCAMLFDLVTGLLASLADGTGWNSKKGKKGILVKTSYLLGFGFGIMLDYFFPYVLSLISIELPFNSPFGMIISIFIIITECISICENFYRIKPDILPHWLIKILSIAKDEINKEEKNEDN